MVDLHEEETIEARLRKVRIKNLLDYGLSVGDAEMADDTAITAADAAVQAFIDVIERNRKHLPMSEDTKDFVGSYATFILFNYATDLKNMASASIAIAEIINQGMKRHESN